MEIYIEKVIIENYLFTYFLSTITTYALKCKVGFLRKNLGAIIATVLAVMSTYINLSPIYIFLYKFLTCYLVCYITFPSKNVKNQIANFFLFTLLSTVYAGVMFIIFFTLNTMNITFNVLPCYAVIIALIIITKLLKSIIKLLFHKTKISQFTYQIELTAQGKSVITNAYLDSGNFLIDNISQKPVILISYSLANKLIDLELEDIILKNYSRLKNHHYIEMSTANKKSKILVFEINSASIRIDNKNINIESPIVGLSMVKFNCATDCDVLISSEVLNYI